MTSPQGVRVCVLLSGGVDSAVLLARMMAEGRRVIPLYVRSGLRWEEAELYWIRRLLAALRAPRLSPLVVVDAPLRSLYGSHWSLGGRAVPDASSPDAAVYLPGRNVLLATYAAIHCARQRGSSIALGILKGNPFGDASPSFFHRLERCLTQALRHPIRLLTPLRRHTKAQVMRMARAVPLALTFSCLRPRRAPRRVSGVVAEGSAGEREIAGQPRPWLHCGRCNKCAERQRAFRLAGLSDPTRYAGR